MELLLFFQLAATTNNESNTLITTDIPVFVDLSSTLLDTHNFATVKRNSFQRLSARTVPRAICIYLEMASEEIRSGWCSCFI